MVLREAGERILDLLRLFFGALALLPVPSLEQLRLLLRRLDLRERLLSPLRSRRRRLRRSRWRDLLLRWVLGLPSGAGMDTSKEQCRNSRSMSYVSALTFPQSAFLGLRRGRM